MAITRILLAVSDVEFAVSRSGSVDSIIDLSRHI